MNKMRCAKSRRGNYRRVSPKIQALQKSAGADLANYAHLHPIVVIGTAKPERSTKWNVFAHKLSSGVKRRRAWSGMDFVIKRRPRIMAHRKRRAPTCRRSPARRKGTCPAQSRPHTPRPQPPRAPRFEPRGKHGADGAKPRCPIWRSERMTAQRGTTEQTGSVRPPFSGVA